MKEMIELGVYGRKRKNYVIKQENNRIEAKYNETMKISNKKLS